MQATSDRPRFRQDLVAEPIEDGANRFIDVMDPDTGTLFRFFEVEYSLACAMDGQRDVAGIVKWADEELGLKTNAKEVSTVIATLGELGYLERGAAAAAAAGAAAAAAPAVQPPKTPTPPVGIKKVPEQPALNRWDAPTAMGDVDEYLERGVVHASNRSNTPAPDVELGQAGTRTSQSDELPRAPNLELGAPGATAAARPAGKVEDIALGAPGKSASVEVDLAADVPLSPAAVKEAVRQSQVMSAVNVPPELAAELDKKPEAKPEPKVEAKPEPKVEAKPAAKAEPKPEAKPAAKAEPKVEAKPAAKAEPKVEAKPAKPEVKPEPRPAEPKAPPAPSSGVSPVLIAAVIIAVLAAGGFAVWKFVINKKDAATDTSAVKPPPPPQPEPPPPPPVETAKLATEAPVAKELKPSAPGQIATIVASDTAVKEGDPIARLVGFKPLEGQVAALDKSLAKAKDAIAAAEKERDAAQTAGNKNGVTAAEKKLATAQKTLADQEAKLATAKAALDKFLIKSPGAGKITAVAKPNAKVTPTDVIATLTREPTLVATFKSAGEVAVGTRVLLAIKGSDQKLSCTVAQTGGDGVKVACPKDAASDGTEVTYAGVDPNAPSAGATPAGDAPKAGEPAAGPAGSGATGSAEAPAPAGSAAGSAAAGSAAADEAKPEEHKADDKKPEESADKPAEKKRPRSRPRATPTPADKGSAGSGGDATAGSSDTPADKPADPAPAPAPTPAGSAAP